MMLDKAARSGALLRWRERWAAWAARAAPPPAGLDFAPDLLALQQRPPSPLPRRVLWTVLTLLAVLLLWAALGRLDIIAVAQGKLIPQRFVQIVQPAEAGVLRELLVQDGDTVATGQVLARLDAQLSGADLRILERDLALRALQLRRIDAELMGTDLEPQTDDPADLQASVVAQLQANRRAQFDALTQERAVLAKAGEDLAAAVEVRRKLEQTLPLYREQASAHQKLAKAGHVSALAAKDREREHIEKAQDLRAQIHSIASLRQAMAESRSRLEQLDSAYRSRLQAERVEAEGQHQRLQDELAKQRHRHELLELKAPVAGIIKDLATRTLGTVVSPGAILMTLVPADEPLKAEVWIKNEDAGFIRPGLPVQIKLAAYPFQKYGLVEGAVEFLSPDASDLPESHDTERRKIGDEHVLPASGFRALVTLSRPWVDTESGRRALSAGMQLSAEIKLGRRSVLEYLLSPVTRAAHEAARER
jgi:HlyD family secretion protein